MYDHDDDDHDDALISGMIAGFVIVAIAIAICFLFVLPTAFASPTPPPCYEDEPCWDCETMGNLICGTDDLDGPMHQAGRAWFCGVMPDAGVCLADSTPLAPTELAPAQALTPKFTG